MSDFEIEMESRVNTLESKTEYILEALFKLQEWMDKIKDINDIDEGLFADLHDRVTKLENNT